MLRWILPLSLLLHAGVVMLLPSAVPAPHEPRLLPPLALEVIEPPAAPEPPPQTNAPAPAAVLPSPKPAANAPASARIEEQAPVDFTSTTFSNEGPGWMAVGPTSTPPVPTSLAPAPPASVADKPAPPPPKFIPATELGRSPRPPEGLELALERNYPTEARRLGVAGTATLRVWLEPDGRVAKVMRAHESYAGFGEACERTVRSGRWEPPLDREGHAVGTEIKYVCRFEVRS